MKEEPLLKLVDLRIHFPVTKGTFLPRKAGSIKAVDGVTLDIRKGETLGLVGESGCGKSTLARGILQLINLTSGEVILDNMQLVRLSAHDLRERRKDFQLISQNPYASLNPRMTIYDTLSESVERRHSLDKRRKTLKVAEWMERVGLNPAWMRRYPHEFSGGQRQRIAIARALATEPKLIIADEPVSALDVSIQSQILNLLSRLQTELSLTMVFISHDLSVVKYLADRIAVMYLGKLVELGSAFEIMDNPLHYYTKSLLSAVPLPDPGLEKARERIVLKGEPPSPANPPQGCAFAYRTPLPCTLEEAAVPGNFKEVKTGHWVEVHKGTIDDPELY